MSCFPVSLAMMSHCNSESFRRLNARLAIQQIKESLRSNFNFRPEIALSLMCTSMNSAVFDFLALQIEHSKGSYVVFERGVRAWCSSAKREKCTIEFFSHYHSLILIEMHDRNARLEIHTFEYTLEYTLEYYENLTRASRSNTGRSLRSSIVASKLMWLLL